MMQKQRLLYLFAATPNIFSNITAHNLVEPVSGFRPEISILGHDCPFDCVHDAMIDGWHIIKFPVQEHPIEDHEIDQLGYEFVLQKLETVDQ